MRCLLAIIHMLKILFIIIKFFLNIFKCEKEWFHFECVGIIVKPKGKWFCKECSENIHKKNNI